MKKTTCCNCAKDDRWRVIVSAWDLLALSLFYFGHTWSLESAFSRSLQVSEPHPLGKFAQLRFNEPPLAALYAVKNVHRSATITTTMSLITSSQKQQNWLWIKNTDWRTQLYRVGWANLKGADWPKNLCYQLRQLFIFFAKTFAY